MVMSGSLCPGKQEKMRAQHLVKQVRPATSGKKALDESESRVSPAGRVVWDM